LEVCTLGYGRVLKDNQEASIVPPFDLEAPIHGLIFSKGRLDVLGLEFLGEAREVENAGDGGREACK